MSNGNDDRPLAKWTTGNLIGLLGFVAAIITAWVNLNGRVSSLESDARHVSAQVDKMDAKLDKLLERADK
jgi:hypothetical protein